MSKKKRKKVLVYGYIALNVGDDYFFDILFRRYPQVDFYFFPPSVLLEQYISLFEKYKNVIMYQDNPAYLSLRSAIPDCSVPLNLFPIICDCAREMDAFIIIGGSLFIQSDHWRNDDRFILKEIMKDKPSFILGCNFGPGDNEYKNYLLKWFKGFQDVCFREEESYQLFSKNRNSRKADDIVLIEKKRFSVPNKKKIMGISVVELKSRKGLEKFRDDYIAYHVDKVKKAIQDGYQVIFFSFCSLDGDTEIIEEIKTYFTEEELESIHVEEYVGNLHQFLKLYRKCSLIIGSRLHSILIAITNNQDFIPVSYSKKIDHLLEKMDSSVEILKIDGNMQQKVGIEKVYNMKHLQFNSKMQFLKLDLYFKKKSHLKKKNLAKQK